MKKYAPLLVGSSDTGNVKVAPDTAENDRAAHDRLCRYVCEGQQFLHQDTSNKLDLVLMDYTDK